MGQDNIGDTLMPEDEISAIRRDFGDLRGDLSEIRKDIQRLEIRIEKSISEIKVMLDTEAARCPHRELVSQIPGLVIRTCENEKSIFQVRLDAAKTGALGGGAIAAVIVGVAKAMGWV